MSPKCTRDDLSLALSTGLKQSNTAEQCRHRTKYVGMSLLVATSPQPSHLWRRQRTSSAIQRRQTRPLRGRLQSAFALALISRQPAFGARSHGALVRLASKVQPLEWRLSHSLLRPQLARLVRSVTDGFGSLRPSPSARGRLKLLAYISGYVRKRLYRHRQRARRRSRSGVVPTPTCLAMAAVGGWTVSRQRDNLTVSVAP